MAGRCAPCRRPKIRTGLLQAHRPLTLNVGDTLRIATGDFVGGPGRVATTFDGLAHSVRPGDCLFIGDSAADMEAGRRAGIPTCAVTWGYGEPDELARWEPNFWIDAPHQLLPDY